jgi:ketosteroid isomerase-like protein
MSKVLRVAYRQVCAGRPRLIGLLAAADVEFSFPGDNSFAGTYRGKPELMAWLRRFGALQPDLTIHEVMASGPPWRIRVGFRFTDAIGNDYRNEGMELVHIRWGKVRRAQVFLNTEVIAAWEHRHPEVREALTA